MVSNFKVEEGLEEMISEISSTGCALFDIIEISDGLSSAWYNFMKEKTVDSFSKMIDATTIYDYISIYEWFIKNDAYKPAAEFALFAFHSKVIPNVLGEIFNSYALMENIYSKKQEHLKSDVKETDYVKYLFDERCCFHDVDFIQREYEVPGIGKIDILGKQTGTNRPVVIECKLGNKNPNKQLIAYGSHFDNPILIGITEEPIPSKMQLPNINYLTYYEMGIRIKGRDYDTDQPPVYGIFNEETGWR